LQQVTFEFTFNVGKLQASLFRSTSPTTEKPLAHAVLEGFGLTFELRQYDMSVDLFLRTVTLAMTEEGQESTLSHRPLLSSGNTGDKNIKLLKVRYNRVQKESPEFMTVHEGVDQSIDVELSTFNIGIAPEPILSLYDFIMTTFVPQDEQAVIDQRKETEIITEEESIGHSETVVEHPKSADKLRVRVKLTSAQGENRVHRLIITDARLSFAGE
jgi:vacuolar protein sorting-associated protein 13A/C